VGGGTLTILAENGDAQPEAEFPGDFAAVFRQNGKGSPAHIAEADDADSHVLHHRSV